MFNAVKMKTNQCAKLEAQLTTEGAREKDVSEKKKKYKNQSKQLASKVQKLNEGLAYYSQWNEQLKKQIQQAGMTPKSGTRDVSIYPDYCSDPLSNPLHSCVVRVPEAYEALR